MGLLGRCFPCVLPGWIVALETTLGSKQGTLFKAPRNADKPKDDSNVWTKSDYWNLLANKPTVPLQTSFLSKNSSHLFVKG